MKKVKMKPPSWWGKKVPIRLHEAGQPINPKDEKIAKVVEKVINFHFRTYRQTKEYKRQLLNELLYGERIETPKFYGKSVIKV